MKTVAIIQARMGSTRLPGKVMKKLKDKTVLGHVINRIKETSGVDQVVVATTILERDDIIVEEACSWGATTYRGDEEDVLARYYHAAKHENADIVIRITSDCPLIDVNVTSEMIDFYKDNQYDYVSNTLTRTYPRGLDVEIFGFEVLERAFIEAVEQEEREHVTPYVYKNPSIFHTFQLTQSTDLSGYRLTLDTVEDWILIEEIYNYLYSPDSLFGLNDIMTLMHERPELKQINISVEQKKIQVNE